MKKLLYFLLISILGITASCIEDSISTSPSDQPTFSVDTLQMGLLFTEQSSPTYSFIVYNRHDKVMSINSITMRDGSVFRINVDGVAGKSFSNVEIRPNDSIFVFVEATIPPAGTVLPVTVEDVLDFVTNGVTRSVIINANGQDVKRIHGLIVEQDMTLDPELPIQVFDSIVVMPGATLTIPAGTNLHFHDKALLRVRGTLRSLGNARNPVTMAGDRTDNVVGSIPFDLMASQWQGVEFLPGSSNNFLTHTVIKNTVAGVLVDSLGTADMSTPQVVFHNCRLRNSARYALEVIHSSVHAIGSEIADASMGVMSLRGGSYLFNQCTFANYYLFSVLGGPSISLSHVSADDDDESGLPMMQALFSNSIIYGLGKDLSHDDLTGTSVTFNTCLFKSNGNDDANFLNCLWDKDPLYNTVREDYIFDYRLKDDSPARDSANPELLDPRAVTDFHGVDRVSPLSLGAYQYQPAEQ